MELGDRTVESSFLENILAQYHSALPHEVEDFSLWYRQARFISRVISVISGISIENSAGVVATLSPMNRWEDNVSDAIGLARDVTAKVRTTEPNKKKAIRILSGESADSVLSGEKVRAFWSIIAGHEVERVAVDRHLYRAAMGSSWISTRDSAPRDLREYREIEQAFVAAAERVGVSVSCLSSVVWAVMRRSSNQGQRGLPFTQEEKRP